MLCHAKGFEQNYLTKKFNFHVNCHSIAKYMDWLKWYEHDYIYV